MRKNSELAASEIDGCCEADEDLRKMLSLQKLFPAITHQLT